jgi:hypothetical protein
MTSSNVCGARAQRQEILLLFQAVYCRSISFIHQWQYRQHDHTWYLCDDFALQWIATLNWLLLVMSHTVRQAG